MRDVLIFIGYPPVVSPPFVLSKGGQFQISAGDERLRRRGRTSKPRKLKLGYHSPATRAQIFNGQWWGGPPGPRVPPGHPSRAFQGLPPDCVESNIDRKSVGQ